MPSADQVPVNRTHSTMLWPMWVVLIALPTFTSARCPARSRSSRECGWFFVAFAPGHHRPRHSGDLVGERDGCDLGGSPRQQRGKPRPMLGAMDLGIPDHGECACGEQAAKIAI